MRLAHTKCANAKTQGEEQEFIKQRRVAAVLFAGLAHSVVCYIEFPLRGPFSLNQASSPGFGVTGVFQGCPPPNMWINCIRILERANCLFWSHL